jgi:hypothetical protein
VRLPRRFQLTDTIQNLSGLQQRNPKVGGIILIVILTGELKD